MLHSNRTHVQSTVVCNICVSHPWLFSFLNSVSKQKSQAGLILGLAPTLVQIRNPDLDPTLLYLCSDSVESTYFSLDSLPLENLCYKPPFTLRTQSLSATEEYTTPLLSSIPF